MQHLTLPNYSRDGGITTDPATAAKALAAVPNTAFVSFGDAEEYVPAKLLKDLVTALKPMTELISIRMARMGYELRTACKRNVTHLKTVPSPRVKDTDDLVRVNFVAGYAAPQKLSKEDKAAVDWLLAAQLKKIRDERDIRWQTVLVRNGYAVASDGRRAHVRRADGPLALPDGVYSINTKGGILNVQPGSENADWPDSMQRIFVGHGPDEVILRIQAGALRAACKKQANICFALNGLNWQLQAPWVLDALKMADDGDAVGMSINGIYSGQVDAANWSVYLSGAGWGAMIMQYYRPIDHYHWTPGKPFPGASQPVTIGGYADDEKSVSICVQIDRAPMPAVEMLWPEGL